MKEAGCWMIMYGIESGDDEVLKLNKKGATVAQAIQAVKWTKEAGIKVWGYFMLGLYGDTKESMEKTIKLSLSEQFDIVNFAISAPYPGTEWYELAVRNNWLTTEKWEDFDQNYKAIVEQPDCPTSLVRKMQRTAYKRWYLRLYGIRRFIEMFKLGDLIFWFKTIRNHM